MMTFLVVGEMAIGSQYWTMMVCDFVKVRKKEHGNTVEREMPVRAAS
jgi:hypothetical protein